jgi:hypothetical protein
MRQLVFASVLIFMAWADNVAAQAPKGTSLRSHRSFSSAVATLKGLIAREGKAKRNTILVSEVFREEGREYLYAYWKEDKSIIILHLPLEKDSANYEWLYSKARVDLETDIVPTQEDIGGSSFLVDRPWVNRILKKCHSGYRLMITTPVKRKAQFNKAL